MRVIVTFVRILVEANRSGSFLSINYAAPRHIAGKCIAGNMLRLMNQEANGLPILEMDEDPDEETESLSQQEYDEE